MNVANQFEQICVGVYENRVIALFEQMSGREQPSLRCPGVLPSNPEHQPSQRHITYLHQRVDVIGHVAIRVQARVIAVEDSGDQSAHSSAIGCGKEDVLLVITAQCYVVHPARDVNSKRPRHRSPAIRADDRILQRARITRAVSFPAISEAFWTGIAEMPARH